MIKRTLLFLIYSYSSWVSAEFVPETISTKMLPNYENQQWFWVYGPTIPFATDSRSYLFDQEGENLGQLNNGMWFNSLLIDNKRRELLAVETYFTRGTRGERTDVVTTYDANKLLPKEEVTIPSKRMHAVKSSGASVLSDDNRFMLVVNYTPAQSISVVDLNSREFVNEIETPGCSVVYPAGNRDFFSICGNGGFMHIRLDNEGQTIIKERGAPIFDPVHDFLTTAASRKDNTWYFVSFENNVYAITMDSDGASVSKTWSLVSEEERSNEWRISGQHHTALHKKSDQFFVLMHQGAVETFEEPGEQVWVYDVNSGQRINTIELDDPALSINVNQSEKPTLYALAFHVPLPDLFTLWIYATEGEAEVMKHVKQVVDIYDANSGDHRVKVDGIPPGYMNVVQPWE